MVDRDSVAFKARACSDVHVGLALYSGISAVNMYEVVFGGWNNSKSAIRSSMQQTPPEKEKEDRDVLSCTESRMYWVSWPQGRIAMGRGTEVGQREILNWEDPNFHEVNAISISNWYGFNGTWEFGVPLGRYTLDGHSSSSTSSTSSVSKRNALVL